MAEWVERFSPAELGKPPRPHKHGQWVRYADHTAALAAKDEEIERLKDRIEDLCLGRFDSAGNDEIDVQKARADKAEQALAQRDKELRERLEDRLVELAMPSLGKVLTPIFEEGEEQ